MVAAAISKRGGTKARHAAEYMDAFLAVTLAVLYQI
jgi:hypothetical protein